MAQWRNGQSKSETDHKEYGRDRGTPDAVMHRLHICCTMRSGIIWNFSAVECGKVTRGNLWNVTCTGPYKTAI